MRDYMNEKHVKIWPADKLSTFHHNTMAHKFRFLTGALDISSTFLGLSRS